VFQRKIIRCPPVLAASQELATRRQWSAAYRDLPDSHQPVSRVFLLSLAAHLQKTPENLQVCGCVEPEVRRAEHAARPEIGDGPQGSMNWSARYLPISTSAAYSKVKVRALKLLKDMAK